MVELFIELCASQVITKKIPRHSEALTCRLRVSTYSLHQGITTTDILVTGIHKLVAAAANQRGA